MTATSLLASVLFLVIGLGVGFFAGSASNMARMQAEGGAVQEVPTAPDSLTENPTEQEREIIEFLATFNDLNEEPTLAEIHHRHGWKGVEVAARLAQTEEGQL